MSVIFLVRHAQASFGSDNYDRLSAVGVRQARILAGYWLKMGETFDAVYCGRMQRQLHTAQELVAAYTADGRGLAAPVTTEFFDEYDSTAVWESQIPQMIAADPSLSRDLDRVRSDKKAFQKLFEQAMNRWVAGIGVPADHQRWDQFSQRVRQGLATLMQRHGQGKNLVVFTSGGPISAAIQMAMDLSDQKAMQVSWQIMNASVTRLKYNPRGVVLSGFNEVAHLEMEMDKTLITYR
jgi:broad specificity phosphatase PhoE